MIIFRTVFGTIWLLLASSCLPPVTQAQLFAIQLITTTDRVVDAAIASNHRVDQAALATQAARSIAELLSHRYPNAKQLGIAVAIVDISLTGLANGPGMHTSVREAQSALLTLRMEMARRRRIIFPNVGNRVY